MRARARLLTMGAALPAVALAGQSCRTATQVTLDIGTNVACADMRGVDIVIAADSHDAEHRAALDVPGTRFATATTTACVEGPSPRKIGTLVVTPAGGDGAVVVVAAFGSAQTSDCMAPNFAPGCIVARRRFGFVDHTAVTLPIVLDPVCAGIPCNENSTCVGKKCVDSKVDCASGACADPGQRNDDGGLVEVDAFSPLDATGGMDGSEGGGPDGSADGSSGDGAVTDGQVEGGTDAGNGASCPMSPICAEPAAVACPVTIPLPGPPPPPTACCYATALPVCRPLGTCLAISGCCRSSDDCPNAGDICCASTPTAGPTTTVVCKTPTACMAAAGVAVCSMPGTMIGCGTKPGATCLTGVYSKAPDYYACS